MTILCRIRWLRTQVDGWLRVMALSGGRMKIGPEGSDDNLLWIDWQGAKWPAAAPQW